MSSGRDERSHTASVEKEHPVNVTQLESAQVLDSARFPSDARPRVVRIWAEDCDLPDVDRISILFRNDAAANHAGAPAEAVLPAA
jgi:hypothetical protein